MRDGATHVYKKQSSTKDAQMNKKDIVEIWFNS